MVSNIIDQGTLSLFTSGFELIRDRLPRTQILEIISEVKDVLTEDQYNREAIFMLETLYTAIGEQDSAMAALSQFKYYPDQQSIDPEQVDRTVLLLRTAQLYQLKGDVREAERLYDEVIALAPDATTWIAKPIPGYMGDCPMIPLCSLLAYGYRNDRKGFIEAWHAILKRFKVTEPVPDAGSLGTYIEQTLMGVLPVREQIDGINFLFTFGIRDCREPETFSLVTRLNDDLKILALHVSNFGLYCRFADCLREMEVTAVISDGAAQAIEDIIAKEDAVSTQVVSDAIEDALALIRRRGREMRVLFTMTNWSLHPKLPAPEMISRLHEQSPDDDTVIANQLELLRYQISYEIFTAIISSLSLSKEQESHFNKIRHTWLKDACRYKEADALAAQDPALMPTGEEADKLKLKKLRKSGNDAEEFQYLKSCITEGRMLKEVSRLFELGLCVQPVELSSVLPSLLAHGVTSGANVLKAHDLMQKDLNRGLALIEQAQQAGFPRDLASVYAARFLAEAGYPKRVVGLCEKMIKKSVFPQYAYPLLIDAYRALGKEKEAQAAEELAGKIRRT